MPFLQEAKAIFTDFVDDRASQQINIKSAVRVALEKAVQSGEVLPSTFVPAQNEIYMLMEKDNFSRFKRSEMFNGLLLEIDPFRVRFVCVCLHCTCVRSAGAFVR